jgi:hypothetical protein
MVCPLSRALARRRAGERGVERKAAGESPCRGQVEEEPLFEVGLF